ncbi:MAG: S1/P1 nuclease [Phycisphaerae bacterium]|nr:S1/P1 nuclease [Phycisphaerae bacterium]
MSQRFVCIIVVLLALVFPRPSFGWIDAGHKVIALIAWEDLTDKTKSAVDELLQQHPQYQKYLLTNLAQDGSDATKSRFAFATAATWPDMVRSKGNPMNTLYNHPTWHYIDLPFFEGYGNASTQPAPAEAKSTNGEPTNAIEALLWAEKQLRDQSIRPSDRAIALCWLEHLVGDIHQPLHAVSMFSPDYPEGDKGGNAEWILSDPPYPNSAEDLHLYWDSLPGNFKSQLMIGYVAAGVRADPQFSRQSLKPLLASADYMAWAKESHDLAVKFAYADGHLDAAKSEKGRKPDRSVTIPGLPINYEINAEHVAAHQVALGGYRLADVLNRIFGSP